MARITVEGCLDKVHSRFELAVLLALVVQDNSLQPGREPLVEWEDDKPTIVALREIEEGLINNEIRKNLEDMLLRFSLDSQKPRMI